ncbi:MAG: excinuclease ABC subunit UvrA [Ignavibacteria bacterium]|nr:excinuclease ABC subunit UvrA [Ignavibacteria bacterium]
MPRRTPGPARGAATRPDVLSIRGARVHNLKNVSLEIPRNQLVVMTGLSGSGKSSLAFDTIYAEGQRRYVESLSAYARQFLERMEKPDLDSMEGIGPAMAIEQKTNTRNPRSTVATSTEIYDYLRLLYARIGSTICRGCGKTVIHDSAESVVSFLHDLSVKAGKSGGEEDLKVHIAFPVPVTGEGGFDEGVAFVKKEGFFRLLYDRELIDINAGGIPDGMSFDNTFVLVDRLRFQPSDQNPRLIDSLETAFSAGSGWAVVLAGEDNPPFRFNRQFACAECRITYPEPEPRLFSFNSPVGACPDCQGFGRAIGIDLDLVIPDRSKTLRQGVVQPWKTPKFSVVQEKLVAAAEKRGIRLDVPYGELKQEEVDFVLEGSGTFEGVYKFFKRIERKSYKIYYRVLLSRYRGYTQCGLCKGSRLRAEALDIRVGGRRISDVVAMTVTEALQFVTDLKLTAHDREVAKRILDELRRRLKYLDDVGIGYLTLERLSNTLSGGESQRINLATSLGSSLVGAFYVLDEPSIGLHPRDNEKLIGILKALRDIGNTVLVVEHDRDIIRAADYLVDLGPGAGEHGGEIVFAGTPDQLLLSRESLTGAYLSGEAEIPVPAERRNADGKALSIRNASVHNLKRVDVTIPLGVMVCVTGVSGSGKSTLVFDVLHRRLKGEAVAGTEAVTGADSVAAVESVDQSPIGRTPRSNPATYIGVFDLIRTLFSRTPASRIHGFKPGHFSFNVPGGRCEACEGDGVIKVEMQFMADLYLTCDSCKGSRYQKEVLDVQWNGASISDILGMPVAEAIGFFGSKAEGRRIALKLKVLDDVGLGYIRLGQSATSLSGGEAQRVKLAAHLGSSGSGATLFLFDEPTTGLHFDDIRKLLRCFNSLIDRGNSVVIIEHNLDVIKCADHVIDLGPEAGEGGGTVVAEGTPEEVALNRKSLTGKYLVPLLGIREEQGTRRKKRKVAP